MKKILLSMALVASMSASEYGVVNGELRAFSFDRSFSGHAADSKAVTVGGIVRYETPKVYDVSATMAYYGSFNTGVYSDTDGKSSGLLKSDGGNLNFFGEANLKYDDGEYQAVIGRQRLSTPLANDHDLRLLPSVYNGAVFTYKPLGLQVGTIDKYSGFGSKYDSLQPISPFNFVYFSKYNINAQYITAYARDYYYVDYTFTKGQWTAKCQIGGNRNSIGKDSEIYGAKISYTTGNTTVSALGDVISGNDFKVIESGALFTDLMQGYGKYEPSVAYGASVSQTLGKSSLTGTVVNVNGGIVDDYVEYQADGVWQMSGNQKLRFRYSYKDQSPQSAREDRKDMRVIYYYSF